MSRTDIVTSVALGVVIGVATVVLFLFLASSESIDAPSLDSHAGPAPPAKPSSQAPAPDQGRQGKQGDGGSR